MIDKDYKMRTFIYSTISVIVCFVCLFTSVCTPQTIAEDNQYSAQPLSLQKEYILGPGDMVEISVDLVDEISATYTVTAMGMIEFPTLLKPIRASGLTVKQLRETLVEQLKFYMYKPSVTVRIIEYHSHKVLLLGPFAKPGKHELKQEEVPLLDLILEAGGLRELRDNDKLIILREAFRNGNSHPKVTKDTLRSILIDLHALLREGDVTQNVMIRSGDVIYISSFFEPEPHYIYVTGGRRGAAAIPYEKGLTVLKALLRTGIVPDDINTAQVKILREQVGEQQILPVGLTHSSQNNATGKEPLLQPEDVIILPGADSSMVYVMGRVNSPQAIPYQKDLTILQAILKSGGFTQDAVASKVRVLREGALEKENQLTVNVDAVLDGDKTQNLILKAGDIIVAPGKSRQADISVTGKVNNPGLIAYEEGLTLREVIIKAGGFSDGMLTSKLQILSEAGAAQTSLLFDLANISEEAANIQLHPGNLIIVLGATSSEIVSVLGNVARPGIIQFEEGLTVLQAILRSGGFARGAARSKVKIVRGEGEKQQTIRANLKALMDKGDKSQNIVLRPGDIIIVPESFF